LARAWLTGTPNDIQKLQGPSCISKHQLAVSPDKAAAALRKIRVGMVHRFGRALDKITIRGVLVRNVTGTSGEAEVQYNLPGSVAGNYNWVGFELHNGRWKVADCHLPIGGSAVSATNGGTMPVPAT
jgi:hypothetical protein